MNYIQLVNRFWKADTEQVINAIDTRLYFFLVNTCNGLKWKEPFGHSDRFLSQKIGVSINTIREAKNRLMHRNLIRFEVPEKTQKNMFGQTLFWLEGVSTSDTPMYQPVIHPVSNESASIDTPPVSLTDTNYKHTYSNTSKHKHSDTIVSGDAKNSEALDAEEKNKKKSSAAAEKPKAETPKKKPEDVTPHWEKMTATWFGFYEGKTTYKPTFDGAAAKSLKKIVQNLKKRSEGRGLDWTEGQAESTLLAFLDFAYKDGWLKDNFLLTNLDRQFDKIIANAGNSKNNKPATGKDVDLQSGFSNIDAMYRKAQG